MNLATVLPPSNTPLVRSVRGCDLRFWYGLRFPDLTWVAADDVPGGFSRIFLFDSERFLDTTAAAVSEIMERMAEGAATQDTVLTLVGQPFFVLTASAFHRERDRIYSEGPHGLGSAPGLRTVTLDHHHRIWSMAEEPVRVEEAICRLQLETWATRGIGIEDSSSFYVEGGVVVGDGAKLGPGVVIKGTSRIGRRVRLHAHVYVENTSIGDDSTVLPFCVLRDSLVEEGCQIGPYTHLRNGARILRGAKTGNFVELKNSELGCGSKAMHLSYIGDASVGEDVNIGAGTITCNYDGEKKHRTVIEDRVFIGSGTELVAPLKVGKDSYVGAGSTVTEDVPASSLAIARTRQVNKAGWARRRKKKPGR